MMNMKPATKLILPHWIMIAAIFEEMVGYLEDRWD